MLAFIVLSVFFNLKSILMNINKYNTLKTLQTDGNESYVFKKEELDVDFKNDITIDSLLIRKSTRFSSAAYAFDLPFELCNAIEGLDFFAYKSTYQRLGVLLCQFLFSDRNYFTLQLPHSTSEIKTLFVFVERQESSDFFLETEQTETYKSYEYWPSEVDKFEFSKPPFSDRIVTNKSLPKFNYAWSNEQDSYSSQRISKADQLVLRLNISGLCELGSLWIDLGRDKNKIDKVCLENPHLGFGGVAPTSLEACFWLPGSIAFYNDDLDELYFPERE